MTSAAGAAQSARLTTVTRHVSGNSFDAQCEIQFIGTGWEKVVFDLARMIRNHAEKLKDGGTLAHLLKSIAIDGGGAGTLEVEGTVSGGSWQVDEVRLRFNARGESSPATIELTDVKYVDGAAREVNGVIARVNTLTFRRQKGVPKMAVTVASVKNKDSADSFWQNLKGAIKGAAVNMFIEPLPVEEVGNNAMLDFGLAMINGSPTFTFPLAKNLKQPGAAPGP
jgi:hypothetical protein